MPRFNKTRKKYYGHSSSIGDDDDPEWRYEEVHRHAILQKTSCEYCILALAKYDVVLDRTKQHLKYIVPICAEFDEFGCARCAHDGLACRRAASKHRRPARELTKQLLKLCDEGEPQSNKENARIKYTKVIRDRLAAIQLQRRVKSMLGDYESKWQCLQWLSRITPIATTSYKITLERSESN